MTKTIINMLSAPALLLGISLLTTACSEKDDLISEVTPVVKTESATITFPYSVTVTTGSETRVSVADDDELQPVFEEGDQLYVWGTFNLDGVGTYLYCEGTLTLEPNATDATQAVFSGELRVSNGSTNVDIDLKPGYFNEIDLMDFSNITYIVKSKSDKKLGTIVSSLSSLNVPLNNNGIVSTLKEAVGKYSYFRKDGVSSLYPTSPIQIAQKSAFFKVLLSLYDTQHLGQVKSLTATFDHGKNGNGDPITTVVNLDSETTVSIVKNTTTGLSDLEFIIPQDVVLGKETVYNIKIDFTTADNVSYTVNFPSKSGSIIAANKVYSITKMVPPTSLTKAHPVGTIGMLDGREAIVVDLGPEGGKVAVALKNEGASSASEAGTYYTWTEANALTVSGGWYLPSQLEYARMNSYNTHQIETDESDNKIGISWSWTFGTHTNKLYLPFGGYYLPSTTSNEGVHAGYYWTSSKNNNINNNYYTAQYCTGGQDYDTSKSLIKDCKLTVRLFHQLPD